MDAAHHLARQIVPRRDVQLKRREQDGDDIGQMSPAARPKALGKSMFKIVEIIFNRLVGIFSLQHHPFLAPIPRDAYSTAARAGHAARLAPLRRTGDLCCVEWVTAGGRAARTQHECYWRAV